MTVVLEDKRVAAETLAPESRAAWAEAKVAAEAGRVAVAESGCAACENAACAYAACGYGACGDGGRASVCAQTARGKHQHDSGPWEDQMGAHRSRQTSRGRVGGWVDDGSHSYVVNTEYSILFRAPAGLYSLVFVFTPPPLGPGVAMNTRTLYEYMHRLGRTLLGHDHAPSTESTESTRISRN